MFWQVALLALVVWVIDLALRRRGWAQVRYALWLLVLIKLFIPPTFSLPSSLPARVLPAANSEQAALIVDMPTITLIDVDPFTEEAADHPPISAAAAEKIEAPIPERPALSSEALAMLLSGMICTLGLVGIIRPQAMWLHIGATVVIAVLLCVDYIGSTVDYKSTIGHWLKTFDLRSLFQPEVTDRCTGCGRCAEVCPKRMYKVHAGRATVDQGKECCECLACVKQCPCDAIRNANAGPLKGDIGTICDIERILKS